MLVLTLIGTIATIISTIIAVRAKNDAKSILVEVQNEKTSNAKNTGNIEVDNSGINTGIISGINTGEVRKNAKY